MDVEVLSKPAGQMCVSKPWTVYSIVEYLL